MSASWSNDSLTRSRYSTGWRRTAVLFLLGILFFSSCQDKEETQQNAIYTCPMHPEIVRNEPGNCPICGMELVKKMPQAELSDTLNLTHVIKPVNEVVLSNVRSIKPQAVRINSALELQGYITYDLRKINTVAAKTSGRIEKLYAKYTFQFVSKGQKLFDLYSPELLTAQEEYLLLLNNPTTSPELLKSARLKLSLLGITPAQINQIQESKKVFHSVTFYSPYTGYIREPNAMNEQGNDMAAATSGINTLPLKLKEGDYVERGQTLFEIAPTSTVWAVFQVFADDIGRVELKDSIKVIPRKSPPNATYSTIDFIEPVYEQGAKALNIRVYLDNTNNQFVIGDLVTGRIEGKDSLRLAVPEKAVVGLGLSKVVFVKKEGAYHARKVAAQPIGNGWIQVLNGLGPTEEIAENAQFLVDTESFIKTQ